MLKQFTKILNSKFKLNPSHRILIAVSGGVDSCVMAHLFKQSGFECAIAHVNFQLRANDSEDDETFVSHLASDLQMPFYLHKVITSRLAEQSGESIQMLARRIRYDFFKEVILRENYDFIATGHNANDDFETALFHLIKSSNIHLIPGIPRQNENIIRPLIYFSRSEIEVFARKNKITWREDKSNSETKYLRNKIRHKIIPEVENINPSFLISFQENKEQSILLKYFVEFSVELAKKDWIHEKEEWVEISISHLRVVPSDFFVLYEYLKKYGFNYSSIRDIINSVSAESGKLFESEEYRLSKDRDHFFIHAKTKALPKSYTISKPEQLLELDDFKLSFTPEVLNDEIPESKHIAFLDYDLLRFPLTLRIWTEGDKFQPLGMKGMKKVSDFLIDEKVPLFLKNKQYVLLSGHEIIWIIGKRIDHRYRITENTKQTLRIEIQ